MRRGPVSSLGVINLLHGRYFFVFDFQIELSLSIRRLIGLIKSKSVDNHVESIFHSWLDQILGISLLQYPDTVKNPFQKPFI